MRLLGVACSQALLCVLLCSHAATAGLLNRRAGPPSATSATSSVSADSSQTTQSITASLTSSSLVPSSSLPPSNSSAPVTSTSIAPLPTASSVLNSTFFNITAVPAGQLPLQPVINAPWAVAGVLLLICGAVYAFVGIKKKWLHTFFSTAFLASLGTAVLIIYVMSPPVSTAIQGAYLVAVVMTGCILGGGAIVFKEVTECLGLILGGFSLSMWLLPQADGGILPTSTGRIIFISAFCAGTFALYFSRFTREYALIGSIAFGGATATVLGIDCFSQAGLKEFWVYLWAINSNIFPLGVNTYPLTRGIRVELAVTFILFLAGVVSQLKLWKIIRERRAKREAARKESERQLDLEEENVGRQLEADNARDREEWEAARGNGPARRSHVGASVDSGVGDMDSEKKVRHSLGTVTTTRAASVSEDPIEMSELPANELPTPPMPTAKLTAAESLLRRDGQNGVVTVRVARDDVPDGPTDHVTDTVDPAETAWAVGSDGEVHVVAPQSARNSKSFPSPVSSGPKVVPLPFRLPAGVEEDGERDNRSSMATFADEEGRSRRGSLAKRLSVGSANLLRSLSQRSKGTHVEPMKSPELSQSHEELVGFEEERREYNDSVIGVLDEMSDDGDNDNKARAGWTESRPHSREIKADLGDKRLSTTTANKTRESALLRPSSTTRRTRPTSAAESIATSILSIPEYESIKPANFGLEQDKVDGDVEQKDGDEAGLPHEADEKLKAARSVASSVYSSRASLTKGNLPRALSRVAMSYRTTEWAKHLSNAELPPPDELPLDGAPEDVEEAEAKKPTQESAAPLNVEELQQTATNGSPPPAVPRSASAMSNHAQNPTLSRSDSRQSAIQQDQLAQTASPVSSAPANASGSGNPYRSASSGLVRRGSGIPQPIAEESNSPYDAIPEEPEPENDSTSPSPAPDASTSSLSLRPPVPGVVSYSSPQTLIGMREMLLRNKSQAAFYVPPSQDPVSLTPIHSRPASEVGSLYNYATYPTALGAAGGSRRDSLDDASLAGVDLDALPLSQRRELMRQSSLAGLSGDPSGTIGLQPAAMASAPAMVSPPTPAVAATAAAFNSHQPQRTSQLPSAAQREAALANFRSSVAADLRAGSPMLPAGNTGNGRETLLAGLHSRASASMMSLPGAYGRDGAVRQSIDAQRSMLLAQKEAEAQRREAQRLEKERTDRMFEERMRRDGSMLDAHREAMRRMQGGIKE